jgi:hypothetical protein
LLTAHRCLAPFVKTHRSLKAIIEAASRIGDVTSVAEVLKQANDNIAQV